VYQLRIDAEVHIVELSDSVVAPYTYERTMLMEERAKYAMNLQLTNEELAHEVCCSSVNQLPVGFASMSISSPSFWLIDTETSL